MPDTLDRRIGPVGAVAVGASAMIGSGLFVVFGPAVEAAGERVLLALLVAAVIAACNAYSSARLARVHPVAGGTYVYGRERLGPFWGHLAGTAFVVGKISSCAVMALAVGTYAWPEHQRTVALLVLVLVTVVNLAGVEKSARAGIVVVSVVVVAVSVVIAVLLASPAAVSPSPAPAAGVPGVLQAAALLFFAFAGYARLATLGEDVRDPARTIPRAIAVAVVVVVAIYAAAGAALLHVLGANRLAASTRPFVDALESAEAGPLVPVIVAVAALAAAGALLSLLLGVSRTVLAMARDRHLPHRLATVAPRHRVPRAAEVTVALVVAVVVALGDLATSVTFSSFCVLVYYAVANAAALTLPSGPLPRLAAIAGLVGCLVLACSLPVATMVVSAAVLGLASAIYLARARYITT
jgi:APA family basic amino acid/polyamine antiporter